jgi:hypothetical protein
MRTLAKFIVPGCLLISWLILAPFKAESAMSSPSYQIEWDTLGNGGDDTSFSSSYTLRDTLGNIIGEGNSASYIEEAGYRGGIYDQTVSYNVLSQDTGSQVAATSLAGNTVDVTTSTGFSIGDFIGVVENEGISQISGVGRVTSLTPTSLTVDFFESGVDSLVIDGTDDYVYLLSGDTLAFSALSPSSLSTALIGFEANADVTEGYSIYVTADGQLRNGGEDIDAVSDGAVTIGQSEYGAKSSDDTLALSTFDTQDTAFTTTPRQIVSENAQTLNDRNFITLKAAVAGNQLAGAYGQNLTFIFVGNY